MDEMALVRSEEFVKDGPRFSQFPSETVFAYSNFEDFEVEGRSVEGVLLGCQFKRILWYWALFNIALLSRSRFDDCVFQGCSFGGVDFVSCKFVGCRFTLDNLNGACLFADTRFLDCQFENCELTPAPDGRALFTNCSFYDCAQRGTRGERLPFG